MNRAVILAVLVSLLLAAKADSPTHAQANNQATEQRQQTSVPRAPARLENEPPNGDYRQVDCHGMADHDAADLCVQWRAALAAEKSADWSQRSVYVAIGAAILSFASIILVLLALRQGRTANTINMREATRNTRRAIASARETEAALAFAARNADAFQAQAKTSERALKETRKMAHAVGEQVAVAKNAAEQQLRAYLSATGAVAYAIGPRTQPTFAVEISNQGQTPAYDVRILSALNWTTNAPEDVRVSFPDPPREMGTVSGRDKRTYRSASAGFSWPPGVYQAVISKKATLVYTGVIVYRDIFRRRRFTTFMAYLNVDDIVNDRAELSLARRGNRSN